MIYKDKDYICHTFLIWMMSDREVDNNREKQLVDGKVGH